MAARFVVALACIALCQSSPVYLNGYVFRDGRGFFIRNNELVSPGVNRATGSASINGGSIQAYGSATSDDRFRHYASPGQAVAKAEIQDGAQVPVIGSANAVAETPTFYAVPAPATVVSYQQNFDAVPTAIRYEIPLTGTVAESTAVLNGNSESSVSAVRSDGPGTATSSAQTNGYGSYGYTSSNANTQNYGTAYSQATNGYPSPAVAATKTQGVQGAISANSQTTGFGSASSNAKNGFDSTATTANTHGYGSAVSNANIDQLGQIVSSAKTTNQNGVHWRFGSAYNYPVGAGQAQAIGHSVGGNVRSAAQTDGVHGTAHSIADTPGYGAIDANADAIGDGFAKSVANAQESGFGSVQSASNSIHGFANSHSNAYGTLKSATSTNGLGAANADADVNAFGTIKSHAASNGFGAASSSANPTYGTLKAYGAYNGLTNTNVQTSGSGQASSSAIQGASGYRAVNSVANSAGYGTAKANAQSV